MKGKRAPALSRDCGLSYKSAFVLLHELREAMAEEMKGRVVGGEGKVARFEMKRINHQEAYSFEGAAPIRQRNLDFNSIMLNDRCRRITTNDLSKGSSL
ncbi:hypothetical protein [uncultured Bradyrhizobium sp.]|uniref:hypothetical protein n=1 Tax=uncultured Bradyrhizobium sp. TaxID=199684 RepID=UPI0035C97380